MPIRNQHIMLLVIAVALLLISSNASKATENETLQPVNDIRLPALFSNHAVLQRNKPIHIWGWARPEQSLIVKIAGNQAKTKANQEGNWSVYLPALSAGGPYTLTIIGTQTITVKDILIGDVWVCSGQSNMEWRVKHANNALQEIANANFPQIRIFQVPHIASVSPQNNVSADWQKCSPESISGFSAVGYFFGRDLHKNLDIPIGLIGSNWGGTPIEPWISEEGFKSEPKCQKISERIQLLKSNPSAIIAPFIQMMNQWCQKYVPQYSTNQGLINGYALPDFNDSNWPTMTLPATWESQGIKGDGVLWFRKQVEIPQTWIGQDLILNLGRVDDFDQTYVNGQLIGNTGVETIDFWSVQRRYIVPAELVKTNIITIAVRVFDNKGNGGMVGPSYSLNLGLSSKLDPIALTGTWKYQIEFILDSKKTPPRPEPKPTNHNKRRPTLLFNGMIEPLTPFPITGVIWYQGESNACLGLFYRTLMPLIIRDWRSHWNQADMPFLFVQLANYGPGSSTSFADAPPPHSSCWALLREAQLMTLSTPKTAMAVTIDIGEAEDIHPPNKQDVGKRLSLAARAIEYNQSIVYSGPLYDHITIEDNKIRIHFTHIADGLIAKDGPLEWFSIAGKDRKFVWANAKIEGDTVVVQSGKVSEPIAVRYAWESNPQGCNLQNSAGLPASPFRSDNWDNW